MALKSSECLGKNCYFAQNPYKTPKAAAKKKMFWEITNIELGKTLLIKQICTASLGLDSHTCNAFQIVSPVRFTKG